jgi:hypothetical protein
LIDCFGFVVFAHRFFFLRNQEKVRAEGGKKHESSLPLEVVLPDDKMEPFTEDESSSSSPGKDDVAAAAGEGEVHMTPSFDGLAEKMEELTTPKRTNNASLSSSFRSSVAVGHASRFQEQLLEQLRAEQFELLKSLREQKVGFDVVNVVLLY